MVGPFWSGLGAATTKSLCNERPHVICSTFVLLEPFEEKERMKCKYIFIK
jgi:hypothetical protein